MDVTDPSTPEEIVSSVLDDLLAQADELDTDVAADNIVIALQQAGYMDDEPEEPAPARPIEYGYGGPHVVCAHPLNTPCPAPSGFHREAPK